MENFKLTTYREVLNWASSFLKRLEKEENAASWILKEQKDWTLTDLTIHLDYHISENDLANFYQGIQQFAKDYPAQYIVGHEWFYGRKFKVNSDTLIPRPETEEWFARYLEDLPNDSLKVLDIGTGSGVLAVSHQLERPQDRVVAVDISEKAIQVALENAQRLGAKVEFIVSDLTEDIPHQSFDLILSNPPYIGEEEWGRMDRSVRKFEPKEALFALDEGLDIYKRLAHALKAYLSSGGLIILEIGDLQGPSVRRVFQKEYPKATITLEKDMAGKDRVIKIYL